MIIYFAWHFFYLFFFTIIILLVNDQYDDQGFESEEKPIGHDHDNGNLFSGMLFVWVLCLLWFIYYFCLAYFD